MNSPLPLIPLMLAGLAGPTGVPSAPGGEVYVGAEGNLSVPTPYVEDSRVRVDGVLDDAGWASAAVLDGFTQYEPVQGIPASQHTRVRVLVTDDALLFAIEAFDDEPELIRATLPQRDNVTGSDDYVRIILDTYDAQREAYVFSVNPFGVQQDGLWSEGSGGGWGPPIDHSPDFIWKSAGQLTGDGYVVEVEIPLKSLRFPDSPVQDWGLQITRRIQRNDFDESWAPIDANIANQLAQAGKLRGLEDLDPGLFFEVNPVATASRVGQLPESGATSLVHETQNPEFGFDLRYGLTSNLTLDATVNPDFSQVEADAGQIVVNERFAQFIPEARPFFLEGTEIFNLPQNLIYTRSIVNPTAGAKVAGKVGRLNVGYLGSVDEVTSSEAAERAYVNILRARRDLGANSTVGFAYTDRTETGDLYNRVASFDTRLQFNRRYTLVMQAAGSLDGREGADAVGGGLFAGSFDRSGRNLSYGAEFLNITPDFRTRSGFIRRVGITQGEVSARYNVWGPRGALLQRWGPRVSVQGLWDHQDFWNGRSWKEGRAYISMSTQWRGNIGAYVSLVRRDFSFAEEEYDGLFVGNPDGSFTPYRPEQASFQGLLSSSLTVRVSTWQKVQGRLSLEAGESPLFDRGTGTPVDVANSVGGSLSFDFYPTTHLSGSLSVRHESLYRKADGSRYSSATIPRIRAQYQFTKALFVRTIAEYGAQQSGILNDVDSGNPLYSCAEGSCEIRDGSENNRIQFEFLAGYEPAPRTVVFFGYSRRMVDQTAFGFQEMTPQNDGLFLKFSYLFRL